MRRRSLTSREVRQVALPDGEPQPSDFALVETNVPSLADGELLVRNTWLSVDPYMRSRMNGVKTYVPPFVLDAVMDGGAIGTVVESLNPDVPAGVSVLHDLGWREYSVIPSTGRYVVLPEGDLPIEAYLGALGMPGLTAYVALKVIAPVTPADVVFISGAAGAVGTVAARVARSLGAASVIGSAGTPEKCRRLVEELGYDVAINYKLDELDQRLLEAAPDGIDVYLDNVGGNHLQAALGAMKVRGRIALCGAISVYNQRRPAPGPNNLFEAIARRISMRGFIVTDHDDLRDEFVDMASEWMRDGSWVPPETVVDGIENAVNAFIELLRGANTGKMLVRLERH